MRNTSKIRPIAIVLPQFHPIPENDEWWGKGFTEWRNVVKAKPKFRGHYQPHLPKDLGFYDLRLPEVREEQAILAKKFGIHGFCYYHYWFNGKKILERPVEEILRSGKPEFPFMFCWANENWTRVWDGGKNQILLAQKYSEQDDIEHIKYLIPFFKDPRYIRINGKPVFAIYKDKELENPKQTIQIFRREALKHGIDLYICRFDVKQHSFETISENDIDAAIEFQPLNKASESYMREVDRSRFRNKILGRGYRVIRKGYRAIFGDENLKKNSKDKIYNYVEYLKYDLTRPNQPYKTFPGVCPGWDNTSRRKNGGATIFTNSTPEAFGYWVSKKLRSFKPYSPDENLLFINAWNEWAEGNHLEPCERYGTQYLEAMASALNQIDTTVDQVDE